MIKSNLLHPLSTLELEVAGYSEYWYLSTKLHRVTCQETIILELSNLPPIKICNVGKI